MKKLLFKDRELFLCENKELKFSNQKEDKHGNIVYITVSIDGKTYCAQNYEAGILESHLCCKTKLCLILLCHKDKIERVFIREKDLNKYLINKKLSDTNIEKTSDTQVFTKSEYVKIDKKNKKIEIITIEKEISILEILKTFF